MKKKLLSLLLALCLVMALVPMTAFAEGTSVDNWDGTADTPEKIEGLTGKDRFADRG